MHLKRLLSLALLLLFPISCIAETVTITVTDKVLSGKTAVTYATNYYEEEWIGDGTSTFNSAMDKQGKYVINALTVNKVRQTAAESVTLSHADYVGVSSINIVFQYKEAPQDNEQNNEQGGSQNEEPGNNENQNNEQNDEQNNNEQDNGQDDNDDNDEQNNEQDTVEPVIIEKVVEKIVEKPIEVIVEKTVEKIIEIPVEKEVIVEKQVEAPVEKPAVKKKKTKEEDAFITFVFFDGGYNQISVPMTKIPVGYRDTVIFIPEGASVLKVRKE